MAFDDFSISSALNQFFSTEALGLEGAGAALPDFAADSAVLAVSEPALATPAESWLAPRASALVDAGLAGLEHAGKVMLTGIGGLATGALMALYPKSTARDEDSLPVLGAFGPRAWDTVAGHSYVAGPGLDGDIAGSPPGPRSPRVWGLPMVDLPGSSTTTQRDDSFGMPTFTAFPSGATQALHDFLSPGYPDASGTVDTSPYLSKLFGPYGEARDWPVDDDTIKRSVLLQLLPEGSPWSYGTKGTEFVYLPEQDRFIFGQITYNPDNNLSPHEQLVLAGEGDMTSAVGGTMSVDRLDEDVSRVITTEESGHLWQNWTPQLRDAVDAYLTRSTDARSFDHIHYPTFVEDRAGSAVTLANGRSLTYRTHVLDATGDNYEHLKLNVSDPFQHFLGHPTTALRTEAYQAIARQLEQRLGNAGFGSIELSHQDRVWHVADLLK